MKTRTKALVTGIAGLTMLIGTGGTWALWHDTGSLDLPNLTTGHLRFSDNDHQGVEIRWFIGADGAEPTPVTSEYPEIGTGYLLRAEVTVNPQLLGENLIASLAAAVSGIAEDQNIESVTVHVSGEDRSAFGTEYAVITGLEPGDLTVATIWVDFKFGEVSHDGEEPTLDLGHLELKLEQQSNGSGA